MALDLVARLVGQDAGYSATMNTGRTATWRLDQQLSNLTSTMERQIGQSNLSIRQAEILSLADRGATATKVEYALSLAEQIDQQQKLEEAELAQQKLQSEAEAQEAKRQNSIKAIIDSLKQETFELAHGSDALTLYTLKAKGASDEELRVAQRQLEANAALRQGNADKLALQKEITLQEQQAVATAAANQAFVKQTIATGHERNRMTGVSATYLKLKELAERGATEAEIQEYYATVQLNQALDQQNAARARNNQAIRSSVQAHQSHQSASGKNLFAIQALAFGIQDAAQVYGNTGLAGALSASANNLIFMTSLLSPQLAIWTAITVAAAQFAAVLLPTAFNTKAAAEEADRYSKALKEQLDRTNDLAAAQRAFNIELQDVQTGGEGRDMITKLKREGSELDAQIEDRRRQLGDINKAFQEQAEREEAARRRHTGLGSAMAGVGMMGVEGVEEQKRLIQLAKEKNDEINELERKRNENARQLPLAEQNALAAGQEERAEKARQAGAKQVAEDNKRNQDLMAQRWKEEKEAHAKFAKDKAALERELTLANLSEEEAKRFKVFEALNARQQQITGWVNSGLLNPIDGQRLLQSAKKDAAKGLSDIDQQLAEKARKEQIDAVSQDIKEKEKQLAALGVGSGSRQDLAAVGMNSPEGMRRIFDAIGGTSSPQRQIAMHTARVAGYLQTALQVLNDTKRILEENKPIKTG